MSVARRGLGALRRSPRLATLTFAWSLYWAANTAWWFYVAPFYASRGATDTMLGFALGSAMLVGAGFSWVGRPDRRARADAGVGDGRHRSGAGWR